MKDSKKGVNEQRQKVPKELEGLINFLAELIAEDYLKENNYI